MTNFGPRIVRIVKEITRCAECEHHEIHRIWTADKFEHVFGLYCLKTPYESSEWMYCRSTPEPMKFRCVNTCDNGDVRDYALIPEWCPLLKDHPPVFTQEEIKHRLVETGLIRNSRMVAAESGEEILDSIVRHSRSKE